MPVVGVTGRNCAGKDTVADLLVRRGFERHSLSDVLRVELAARGLEVTRPALIDLGRQLREREGPAVLARRVRAMIRTDRVVLVSIRSPVEVASLREIPGFTLLCVDASLATRWRREVERRREGAPPTLAEFRELEGREEAKDVNGQQLGATLALADRRLLNDGTLAELEAKVLAFLRDLESAPARRGEGHAR